MVIDIAARTLGALSDAMNYSFILGACQDVKVISDKLTIPLISAEFANFSEGSVLSHLLDEDLLERSPSLNKNFVNEKV